MKKELEEIRDQQKASWNKFSPGWKKWDDEFMDFLKPMGREIIGLLNLKDDDHVLDIAAGTGEPGLTIASELKYGKVIITDLAEGMLDVAREHAASRGITNVDFKACDVSNLPFADNTFDAISCRLGFMFFPDMQLAAKEMFRVLKPGGRIATSVWDGAEKNFWVTAIGETINRRMQLPVPPPEAPGMFRCATTGLMETIFSQSGFKNNTIKKVNGELNCGTAETYWTMMTEIAAPFVAALSKADNTLREEIKREALETVNQKFTDGNVVMNGNSLVIYGEKLFLEHRQHVTRYQSTGL
jgi:ubiquinone/menaquinone biosynthesis C-methylase UbiE